MIKVHVWVIMQNPKPVDFAIITILPEELEAVLNRFQFDAHRPVSPADSNLTFFEKQFYCFDKNVYSIIATRLFTAGNPNAASLCREMFKFYKPNHVILLGIGGAIHKNGLKIGDVAVADKIIYYEYSKVFNNHEDYRSDPISCNSTLVLKVRGIFESINQSDKNGEYIIKVGAIACGEKVIADIAFQEKLLKINNNFLAVEMEANGIMTALTHENQGSKALVIRGISDNADGKKNDNFHALASRRAADVCWKLLNQYPVSKIDKQRQLTAINSDVARNYLHEKCSHLRADRIFEIKSLGLKNDAEGFIDRMLAIPVDPSLYPANDSKIKILFGQRGQGKSLIVSKMFIETANQFLAKKSELFPLFINANKIDYSIEECIEVELKKLDSTVNTTPYSIIVIIDALDEIESTKGNKLIQEVDFLTSYYPKLSFVITSRPFIQIPEFLFVIELPQLIQSQSEELLVQIAGEKARAIYFDHLSQPLKDCLAIPLFSILFGVYLRDNARWGIDSPYELINFMIEEALKKRIARQGIQDPDIPFVKLALYLMQNGLPKTSYREVMTLEERDVVISSGLVREIDKELFFPLTITRDWFIARGILSKQFNLAYLNSDKVLLYDWIEPLKIATITASYSKLIELFKLIARKDIALASYILDEAIGRDNRTTDDRVNSPEIGSVDLWLKLRECIGIWLQTMDNELKLLIAPVSKKNMKLNALALQKTSETQGATTHDFFWYGWYKKDDKNSDEPLDLSFYHKDRDKMWENFDILFGGSLRPSSYDLLVDSRKVLKHNLEKSIKDFELVFEIPEAYEELAWGTALDLLDLDVRRTESIPLKDIYSVLGKNQYVKLRRNGVVLHIDILKKKVDELILKGDTVLKNYSPVRSTWDRKNPIYQPADSRVLVERTQSIIERSITIYKKIVEKYFMSFSKSMDMYQMFPFTFAGNILAYKDSLGQMSLNHLRLGYCLVPLESALSCSVAIAQKVGHNTWYGLDSYNEFRGVLQKLDILRPNSYKWLSIHAREESLEIFSHYPATEYALKWLSWDLKRLHWIEKEYESEAMRGSHSYSSSNF